MTKLIIVLIICFIPAYIIVDYVKNKFVKKELNRLSDTRDNFDKVQLGALHKYKLNSPNEGSTILIGDSQLTFAEFDAFLVENHIINRQIDGITSRLLYENLDTLCLNSIPQKIIICVGTNDLKFEFNYKHVLKYITLIVSTIKDKLPQANIFIFSLYPISRNNSPLNGKNGNVYNEDITYVNNGIVEIANANNISYIDVHTPLLKGSEMDEKFTENCLNPNKKAFDEVIKITLLTHLK